MIYKLRDYDYELPQYPDKEQILYWNKPKAKQYWVREDWNFEEMNRKWTDDQKIKFVKREADRRKNGIFIWNNGEIVYLTGSHYFFLQYFLVPELEEEGIDFHSEEFLKWTNLVWSFAEDGMMYPQFRVYQMEFFYFLDLTAKARECEGGAISKPRRVGVTACFNADNLNQAMLKPQKKFSLMNKVLTETIQVNYDPIKYNIEHFPSLKLSNGKEIFKPKIAQLLTKKTHFGLSKKDKSAIDTVENDPNMTLQEKTEKLEKISGDELNTHIIVNSTVENANDSTGTYRINRDEVPKYPAEINIENMLLLLRPVARVGTRQVGKIYYFGTSDEKDTPNFDRWKKIYWDSDISNINQEGRTESGLWKWFISGRYAIEGTVKDETGKETELFDQYGNCKEELAVIWIENQIRPFRLKGDLANVQGLKRQYPILETDPFESSTTSACYDTARLEIQLQYLDTLDKKVLAGLEKPYYTKGSLEWELVYQNGKYVELKDRSVTFEVNKDKSKKFGHWTFYELPDTRWRNQVYNDMYDFLCPAVDSPYLINVDPMAYREQIAGGSKAAIVIGTAIDSTLGNMGGKIIATYHHRPSNPNDLIEEVRKALIFCAGRALIENNREWLVVDLLKGRDDQVNNRPNYGKFLFVYENGKFRMWRVGDKIAGISSQEKSIEGYVKDTNIYLREPKNKDEFDYLPTIMDRELLRQWQRFDPNNTERFDKAVAGSLYCMSLRNFARIVTQEQGSLSDGQIMRLWYGVKQPLTHINPLQGSP